MEPVQIFIGSSSDRCFLEQGLNTLKEYGVPNEVCVASVHRGPTRAINLIRDVIKTPGVRVIIGGAASATGLPGVIAGLVQEQRSRIVVFGVRFEQNPGARIIEDASFALSSMPSGVPLAYTGFNSVGFMHACMLAVRMLK